MLLLSVSDVMKLLIRSKNIWKFVLMAKFSQTSFSKLASCHIDLQAIFYEVIKNVDCIVLEGFRGQAAQERDFLEKRTTLEWPHGKHNSNPSNAVDVAPYPINWEDKES